MSKIPNIETERLNLTWPNKDQILNYYHDILGSDMFKTIQWDGPTGPEELFDYWKETVTYDVNDFDKELHLAVIEKKTSLYLGGVSLRPINSNHKHADVGYAFAPKYHGNGFATEAMNALVDEAFRSRCGERVIANIFVGNIKSRNVVEKIGFKYEGTQRRLVKKTTNGRING